MEITKVQSSSGQIPYKSAARSTLIFDIIMSGSSLKKKKIELFFVEGAENPADLFTKNLAAPKFIKFRAELGLEFYSS